MLKGALARAADSAMNLEQLCWEDRLRELGCSAGEEKLRRDLIVAFLYLKWLIRKVERDFLAGPVVIGQGVMVLN